MGRCFPLHVVLSAIAAFAAAAPAYAAVLTLDEAVAIALAENRTVRAAESEADAAKWGQARAISQYGPKVYFNTSARRIDPDTFDTLEQQDEANRDFIEAFGGDPDEYEPIAFETTYTSSVQVQQPLFNGGKEIAGIQAGTREKRRRAALADDARAQIESRVRQAYFETQKAEQLVRTAEEASALAGETLKLTQARFEVGQLSRAEVLRWESQAAQAEGDLVQARNAERLARVDLNYAMGVELDRAWELPELAIDASIEEEVFATLAPLPDMSVIAAHPALRASDESVNLAKSDRFLAVTDVLPSLNFVFDYGWTPNDTPALDEEEQWTAMLTLQIPLFQSGAGAFGIAQSQKNVLAARLRSEELRRGFLQRAASAALTRQAATERVRAARKEVAFAEENLKVVETRQTIGAATNLDLLDAQFTYIQAKTRLVSAVADYRIAGAEWGYLTATE
ncbi:TolC family protein [bacterium]|nr:TolC family protein [bacterium]